MLRTLLNPWATPQKEAVVRQPTSHLKSYLSKMNKTFKAQTEKWSSVMVSCIWTRQCWLTSQELYSSALCGHWVRSRRRTSSDVREGGMTREGVRDLLAISVTWFYLYFIYIYIYIYIYICVYGNCFVLTDDSHLNAHHHPHHSCWVNRQWHPNHILIRMIQNHWDISTSMDLSGTSLYNTNTTHWILTNITQWQAKARWLVNAWIAGFRSEVPSSRWMSHL